MKCVYAFLAVVVATTIVEAQKGYHGYGGHGAIGHGDSSEIHHEQNGKYYKVGYRVDSPHTGNHQARHEEGIGGVAVKGWYKLKEKDGSWRIVEYTADKSGVKAVVHTKHGVTFHGHSGGNDDGGYGDGSGHHGHHGGHGDGGQGDGGYDGGHGGGNDGYGDGYGGGHGYY